MAEPQPPFDMPAVEPPSFPGRVFEVRDLDPGNQATANTLAFRRAIAACHAAGGGTVWVPAGAWLTGPIRLLSHVNLHLERGALVRFTCRPADYLPVVLTRWEGVECYNYSPLIYARDSQNVAVSGEGTLDGQGERWWHWKQLQQRAAATLYGAEAAGVPVEQRVYGTETAALRPQFVQTVGCRNVLIEGVTFVDGPMWTIHPVYCENVLVRGVTVRSVGPNTDGLNPDSCRNVLIEGCTFSTGDDCIAINSGMNEDGWRVGRPCENVVIRDCCMSEGHGAVSIGSGMSGGVRHVYVHDCHVTGGDHGIRLKSVRGRGGFVEDVTVENVQMANLRQEAILLTMFYGSSTAPSRSEAPPIFRDIHVKAVTCEGAGAAVEIRGLPEQPIERVVLED
ncbi:MAG TPA: glycoside hydrolase family 28 protein, partial [Anaerolineae bacterium]|nr:glycoside hydrolase family 28 protein [Anaerolineae bacterium]